MKSWQFSLRFHFDKELQTVFKPSNVVRGKSSGVLCTCDLGFLSEMVGLSKTMLVDCIFLSLSPDHQPRALLVLAPSGVCQLPGVRDRGCLLLTGFANNTLAIAPAVNESWGWEDEPFYWQTFLTLILQS